MPVKLTENLEAEEEFNIIMAKDINAERKNAAVWSDRAVTLIQQGNIKKKNKPRMTDKIIRSIYPGVDFNLSANLILVPLC